MPSKEAISLHPDDQRNKNLADDSVVSKNFIIILAYKFQKIFQNFNNTVIAIPVLRKFFN